MARAAAHKQEAEDRVQCASGGNALDGLDTSRDGHFVVDHCSDVVGINP